MNDDATDGTDDESPPTGRGARTPAEKAGATPLDPERFRVNVGMPVGQRQRELLTKPAADTEVDPVVRRPRRPGGPKTGSTGSRRSGLARLVAAAVMAVAGLAALALAVLTDDDVHASASQPPALIPTTPVISARRVPELVARPVAARNLQAALAPVIAAAPPETCLAVQDGANLVASQKTDLSVVPASNLKIVTAGAALSLLDPQQRFTTTFVTDGAPTDGKVVKGNLYMVGGGDPLLSTSEYLSQLPNGRQPSTDMAAIADQIAATGIREVTGSVVGDGTRYDDVRTIEAWPARYLSQGQVAPLSALVVDDAWTAGSGPGATDPALHAATVLTALLEDRGVTIAGAPKSGVAPAGAAPLTEFDSAPIAETVDEGLRFSDNTTMEMLVKEIGLVESGTGSTRAGLDAISEWMAASGIPTDGVVLDDGSGLSEKNRVTCALISEVLQRDGSDGALAAGLARPGQEGTLDDRFQEASLRDRLRAKTGTLRPVTALSGWLDTTAGTDLAFSFIQNRPGAQVSAADTALQTKLLESMLTYPQRPAVEEMSPGPAEPPR